MRPIATDTADFPQLRADGCIYVDKTAYFHRMISTTGTKLFFLSRPRRFGKSLMISTLKAIFQGRRELFDGLAIANTDWKWEKFPIIHFDMSNLNSATLADFDISLRIVTKASLESSGYSYDDSIPPEYNFASAIEKLSSPEDGRNQSVWLVALSFDRQTRRLVECAAKKSQ